MEHTKIPFLVIVAYNSNNPDDLLQTALAGTLPQVQKQWNEHVDNLYANKKIITRYVHTTVITCFHEEGTKLLESKTREMLQQVVSNRGALV